MFIREKIKKAKNKKKYSQHQLIESIRTASGPRQQIVLNLGHLSLPKHKWKDLANSIERILTNQRALFPPDTDVEALAKHYARKIRQDRLSQSKENIPDEDATGTEEARYETVDINSHKTGDTKTVGAEHVVISQMNEYGFDKILRDLDFTEKQIAYSKMLIMGRMVHPSSERETVRWLSETSGIVELLGTDVKLYDTALHRAAVLLWENHVAIEHELSVRAREVFSLEESIILYDLTNTYFEGSKRGSKVAKHGGKSKEKRSDCPLLTLSLTVDEQGFPKQSKIWEGNVSEPKTLKGILLSLQKEHGLFSCEKTIVMDAGIATEENIKMVQQSGFKYVVVSRRKKYEDTFWAEASEEKITLSDNKTPLRLKLVQTEKEAYLLCHSEAKEVKERGIISRREEKFEEELKAIKEGLTKKNTQKSYDKILERIGRLKERYKVGNFYKIEIMHKNNKVTDIKFEKNDQARTKEAALGTYVLRTNRLDLNGEEISKLHRALTTIEDSFGQMKGALGLRPNYHHTDIPTMAHVNITVLGFHMLAGILKKLRDGGDHSNWDTICKALITHVLVTSTMNTEDVHVIDIRSCTTPTEKQHRIYSTLKIKHTPLGRRCIKSPIKKQRCSAEKSTK